jgi:preprotein translocase subunit YajC
MRKQDQERAALLTSTKKNDKIITHSGIYGTVVSVSEKEDEIVVRVDDNVRLKMVKNSILRNLTNEEAAKEAKAAKAAATAKPAAAPSSTAVTTKEGGA